jgi:hypothetical protein
MEDEGLDAGRKRRRRGIGSFFLPPPTTFPFCFGFFFPWMLVTCSSFG